MVTRACWIGAVRTSMANSLRHSIRGAPPCVLTQARAPGGAWRTRATGYGSLASQPRARSCLECAHGGTAQLRLHPEEGREGLHVIGSCSFSNQNYPSNEQLLSHGKAWNSKLPTRASMAEIPGRGGPWVWGTLARVTGWLSLLPLSL